jgi:hypothetical protein
MAVYILHKNYFNRSDIFLFLIYCHMSFWDPTLNSTTVTPISQVFAFAMFLLKSCREFKGTRLEEASTCITFVPKFVKIIQGQKLKCGT